nr:copia protein [Tanacetum cinerariifolium]
MMGNHALLMNFVEKFLGMVRFGNNDFAVIAGYEDVVIGSMTIKNVYYVEGLGHNIFSIGQFCDKGLEVAFRKSTCFVQNEDGVDLLTACEQGKIHLKHQKSKTAFALNKPLYLLHMDLCGPMRIQSINGKRYVLVVVEDYSRYTWVFFLHLKDKASEVIISFIKKTQVNLQLQVQRVRTDNGTEFKNKTLAKFFDEVVPIPMVEQAKLKLELVGKPVNHTNYRIMIGSLMYVTSSRPDIMFATCDKLVCWSSKKQNYVSISTAESEYVAVSGCCAQVLWMRTQLMDYGFFYNKEPIYCDSKSAIAISCNPVPHTRTKHIDVRYHFIKDHVEKEL